MKEYVDKNRAIGCCSRLPIAINAKILFKEYSSIPSGLWDGTGGRVGVHSQAEAIFLRGYAPAEGDKPVEDREILSKLNFFRLLISEIIPATPQRCLLAKLPAGGRVDFHLDRGDYFKEYIRIHFPIQTNKDVYMLSGEYGYQMRPGEIWALNNSSEVHGVLNSGASSRTHMICDFEASSQLMKLLEYSDKHRGIPLQKLPEITAKMA